VDPTPGASQPLRGSSPPSLEEAPVVVPYDTLQSDREADLPVFGTIGPLNRSPRQRAPLIGRARPRQEPRSGKSDLHDQSSQQRTATAPKRSTGRRLLDRTFLRPVLLAESDARFSRPTETLGLVPVTEQLTRGRHAPQGGLLPHPAAAPLLAGVGIEDPGIRVKNCGDGAPAWLRVGPTKCS
jgi:hypothetical protein